MHDYDKVFEQCVALLKTGIKPTWYELSKETGVARSSLQNIFRSKDVEHPRDVIGNPSYEVNGIPTYEKAEDGDTLKHTIDGIYDEYISVSVSGQIKTPEDLIRVCQIDTEKYIILPPEVRKWDVTIKLRSEHGDDRVVIVPQIYISLKTIARNPEPIKPVIRPIEIQPIKLPPRKKQHGKIKRALIVPDVHAGFRRRIHTQELTPFHDRRVLDIVYQLLQSSEFDSLYFIGDCLDFSEFTTKFTIEPEFYFTTQPALIEWSWWLSHYREVFSGEIKQQEGNHDKRLELMIINAAHAAYGLRAVDELELPPSLSAEKLLALDTLGVEYIKGYPDNYLWLNQNVMIRHGDVVRSGTGDSSMPVVNKTTYTTIFGHIHRREYVSRRIKTRDGDIVYHAICPGCACHIDGRVPGSTSEQQWQQGICVLEYTDTIENIIPVSIDNGVAIYNGRIFKGEERSSEINKMILSSLEKIKA